MSATAEGTEPETDVTLADSIEGPEKSAPSVMEILRAGFDEAAQNRAPKDMILPGYGEPNSELHILYRTIEDYEEVRKQVKQTLTQKRINRAALREIEMGKMILEECSIGSYALIDGEKHDIGLPLGLALYAQMFPDRPGPQSDGEAIILLYHGNTAVLMNQYAQLDRWIRQGGREDAEEMLGE